MKRILFLTTTNLSTNPRILKEIKLALSKGYHCTFVGFELGNWSNKTEKSHLNELKGLQNIYISATKERFLNWMSSAIVWKFSYHLSKIFGNNIRLNAYAENKRCWLLKKQIGNLNSKFDLVIAHNLGTLYPAYQFSKKNNIPFAFDIEDFHPGEKCSPIEKKRRSFLMEKLMPKAKYLTYASPLIGKHSLDLLDEKNIPNHFLVNNCFSLKEFQFKEVNSEKIKLVWFSQNIAPGRGLELIIPALAKYKKQIQLTLIGNLYDDFKSSFLNEYLDFIEIVKPLPQKELNLFLCQFDIGLAIELSSSDFNRDICLTNKIFAYAQSGLFILATDTSGQKQFIEEHQNLGLLSRQSCEEMELVIEQIIDSLSLIRDSKKQRFDYAQKLAWENESLKLVEVWKEVICE